MNRLRLYTTLGCHLCEQLEALLVVLADEGVEWEKVEISDDDALVERYGRRIPVLADGDDAELDRGLEPEHLAGWLAERGWLDETAWRWFGEGGEEPRKVPGRAETRNGRRYLG